MAELGYNYSAPYRGIGQVTPPGLMDAMTAPGRNIGAGIAGMGEGIADMIKRYQQTKAEREYATGKFEGLIAQYLPKSPDMPSGESGGLDMNALSNIVGEKNVKKFVEGKASTADILAMTHSIETAQAEQDKSLARQLTSIQVNDALQRQSDAFDARQQQRVVKNAIGFAISNQNKPDVNNLGEVGSSSVGVSPLSYDEARANLAQYLKAKNAAPETFGALDQILSIAGKKPQLQVGVQPLPGGLGTVVTAGGKTEIVKPDPSMAARMVQGFQGIAPTETEAKEFRQLQADAASSKGLIDELLQLSNTSGASIDPTLRARGKSLSQQLVGKMRTAILGPGTINDSERKIMEDLAANPATVFSMDSVTRSALNTLKGTLDRSVMDKAKSLGLLSTDTQGQGGIKRIPFNPALLKK
jgi:hypothetical protein